MKIYFRKYHIKLFFIKKSELVYIVKKTNNPTKLLLERTSIPTVIDHVSNIFSIKVKETKILGFLIPESLLKYKKKKKLWISMNVPNSKKGKLVVNIE